MELQPWNIHRGESEATERGPDHAFNFNNASKQAHWPMNLDDILFPALLGLNADGMRVERRLRPPAASWFPNRSQ